MDSGEERANFDELTFSKLNDMEASSFEITFSMHFSVLSDLNGDKTLGPDGLIAAFWQSFWDIVRDDVMRMFWEFHETRKFVRSLNATFIVIRVGNGAGLRGTPIPSLSYCISLLPILIPHPSWGGTYVSHPRPDPNMGFPFLSPFSVFLAIFVFALKRCKNQPFSKS